MTKEKWEEIQKKKSITYWSKPPKERELIILKRKNTLLKHYGVDNPSKSVAIREKRQNTFNKKWDGNPMKNLLIREKLKTTLLNRYGVDNISKNRTVQNKIRDKNRIPLEEFKSRLDALGLILLISEQDYKGTRKADYPVKCKKCNSNYIAHIHSGIPSICRNCFEISNKQKAFENLKQRLLKYNMVPLFTWDQYIGRYVNQNLQILCLNCNSIQDYVISVSNPFICDKCNPSFSITHRSKMENDICDFIKELGIVPKVSVRGIIPPYELDIYIEEAKMAIEFNGLFWHSECGGQKLKDYHRQKYEKAMIAGINLIQIFEDEWANKQDIIKSILKNKLKKTEVIFYARNCILKEVPIKEEREFLNDNHLQGYQPSSICYGLYVNKQIIMLLSFIKSRFNKKFDWELIRIATKQNTIVIGGLNKLFSHFKKNYKGSIVSYCDRRYFSGKSYLQIGFKEHKDSSPNYYYMKNYIERYSRIQFQKHRLKGKLDKFDPILSEWENMKNNGYDRIWDAGMGVYIYVTGS